MLGAGSQHDMSGSQHDMLQVHDMLGDDMRLGVSMICQVKSGSQHDMLGEVHVVWESA